MLPTLREELALHPGPRALDGSPTWSLHDPVRNAFFAIDWLSFEILSRWHLGDGEAILRAVGDETPIDPEPDDVEAVIRFLTENELISDPSPQGTRRRMEQAGRRKTGFPAWLLHRYLFFRVPLCKPDKALTTALPWVQPLSSRLFRWLTLTALLVGLIEISRQWEVFVATLVDVFSLQGLAGFGAALVFAKIVHELGHAFAAKRNACRVPTMGVAFLIMFPMAYTDVNEVWKLDDRRKRLAVGSAGIRAELHLAAWATLAWAVMPDGLLRGAAFILATTTWISTLVINASPFLRFDGYFMLMDWLGMPNLHQRAFALGKWRLREALFALGDPPPEALSSGRRKGLIAFAFATWAYRLVVFLGIAILVYTMFPKPLGPFLAVIEIWWFIAQPVWKEFRELLDMRERIRRSPRLVRMAAAVAILSVLALVPLDGRVTAQGVLRPSGYFSIFAPEAARVISMPVPHGDRVSQDDILIELESPDLEFQLSAKEVQAATAGRQSAVAGLDGKLRERIHAMTANRAQLSAEIEGFSAERSRYRIKAPADGVLALSDLDLRPGIWVGGGEQVATVLDLSAWQVVTYLAESDLERVKVGDRGRFLAEHSAMDGMSLTVETIDRDATRVVPEGILASVHGGRLVVRETAAGLVPETAIFRVVLSVAKEDAPAAVSLLRGQVMIFGQSKSLMGEFLRSAASVFVREAGF